MEKISLTKSISKTRRENFEKIILISFILGKKNTTCTKFEKDHIKKNNQRMKENSWTKNIIIFF